MRDTGLLEQGRQVAVPARDQRPFPRRQAVRSRHRRQLELELPWPPGGIEQRLTDPRRGPAPLHQGRRVERQRPTRLRVRGEVGVGRLDRGRLPSHHPPGAALAVLLDGEQVVGRSTRLQLRRTPPVRRRDQQRLRPGDGDVRQPQLLDRVQGLELVLVRLEGLRGVVADVRQLGRVPAQLTRKHGGGRRPGGPGAAAGEHPRRQVGQDDDRPLEPLGLVNGQELDAVAG